MTPRSGKIAKWMGENVEEIMRDSQDLAIDWRTLARGRPYCMGGCMIVIPEGTAVRRRRRLS